MRKAISLVEIIASLVIIGILIALIVPVVMHAAKVSESAGEVYYVIEVLSGGEIVRTYESKTCWENSSGQVLVRTQNEAGESVIIMDGVIVTKKRK